MEIALVSPQSIRIKGKSAAFIANPLGIRSKTNADAVLLLSKKDDPDLTKVEEYRLAVSGAGEYEISGTKVTSTKSGDLLCYFLSIDNSEICITNSSFLTAKGKEFNRECSILAIACNEAVEPSLITEIGPRVLVLFGEKAPEVAKSMGKEASKTSKVQADSSKLPEEMQVTILA